MHSFRKGFFKSRQKSTRFGRSGGGFPRRTGRLGAAAVLDAAAPAPIAFSPPRLLGVAGVVTTAFAVSLILLFKMCLLSAEIHAGILKIIFKLISIV